MKEQPKRRGRPAKSPEQRAQEKERRIPTSFQGRMKFRPGDPHVLDVEFKEARNMRALIIEEIDQINKLLVGLVEQDDPGEAISHEEQALKAFLWDTYKEHKHRDHIIASFLATRRRRLRAKLQAAHTALEIAADLLTPDDKILLELRRALHQEEPQVIQESAQSSEEPQEVTQEEDDQSSEEAKEDDEEAPQITHRHIYGDADALRQQLAEFDERVKEIRSTITAGIGWFEEFYIKRWRTTKEAMAYIIKGEPVPKDVPEFELYFLGPYLKYRWRESGEAQPIYTISMGRIPAEELAAARHWAKITHPEGQDDTIEPWPHL